jgi:hypothetical protein
MREYHGIEAVRVIIKIVVYLVEFVTPALKEPCVKQNLCPVLRDKVA